MDENFGSNFITLTDENGNEIELEYVDTIEYNGNTYVAFYPTEQEDEEIPEEEQGLIILKVVQENGEDILVTPDSDEEAEAAFDQFEAALSEALFEDDE